jgi:hypothetical protein
VEAVSQHKSLEQAFAQLLQAIELCVATRLRVPALILLYSGIDIAGGLDSNKASVHECFTDWVDKYLLPGSSLKCNAHDLYGARCGLVHSYSSVSNLSKAGKVTTIAYAWKPDSAAQLDNLVAAGAELSRLGGSKPEYFIAVQGDDLIDSFRTGVMSFLQELALDPARASAAYAKAGDFLANLSTETAEHMLKWAETVLGLKF